MPFVKVLENTTPHFGILCLVKVLENTTPRFSFPTKKQWTRAELSRLGDVKQKTTLQVEIYFKYVTD
jgi:hypothetical protein